MTPAYRRCARGAVGPPRKRLAAPILAGVILLAATVGIGAETPVLAPYRFAPGDQLSIRVFGEDELSAEFRVPPHGMVSYPLVGELLVRGRTARDVEAELVRRFGEKEILKAPSVSVLVTEFAPRPVYVLGSVRSPGAYEIPLGLDLRLSHAVSLAGGFAPEADRSAIRIRRYDGGRSQALVVDFSRFEDGSDDAANVALEPGDQVVVRELRSVYVIGEVNGPGEVRIPANQQIRVSEALALARGPKSGTADLKEVRVLRRSATGTEAFEVNLEDVLDNERGATDPLVRPGDLIHVPTRGAF